MGAGKSTVGRGVADRLGRPFFDADEEIERRTGSTIADLFEHGEEAFRSVEEEVVADLLRGEPSVIALGGGAVLSAATREQLSHRAVSVLVEVDPAAAWERVRGSGRPLARDEEQFRALYEERRPVYEAVADAAARNADDAVLGAAGIHVGDRLARVAREPRARRRPGRARRRRARRRESTERASSPSSVGGSRRLTRSPARAPTTWPALWRGLQLDRRGTVVALGGGTTTDLAGFAAATYMRGIDWVAVPTSLVGQVDAAIGGKTAIDLPEAKNLVGAFHWPVRTVIDPALLGTLPEEERRNGMSEVVKTGLLAGEALWELPDSGARPPLCCLQGGALPPRPARPRPAARAQPRPHVRPRARDGVRVRRLARARGRARAPGGAPPLRARHRAGRRDALARSRVRVDRERAWEALLRDKKGRLRIVLLGDDGAFEEELPETDVRAALDELIAE